MTAVSAEVGIMLVSLIGVFFEEVEADCPSSQECDLIGRGRDFPMDEELRTLIDETESADMDLLNFQMFLSLGNQSQLVNRDVMNWCTTSPLCVPEVHNHSRFYSLVYGSLAKCGARFCSETRLQIQNSNFCPHDSDALRVLAGYTRCVKHNYTTTTRDGANVKDWQDVCVCAFCDQKVGYSFFYLYYEDTVDNPGVFHYLRIENPYLLDESGLDRNHQVFIENKATPSLSVTLNMYALLDSHKYEGLYRMERETSDCSAGMMQVVKLKNYS